MPYIFNATDRLNKIPPHFPGCDCDLCVFRELLVELHEKGKKHREHKERLEEIKAKILTLNVNRYTGIYHCFIDIANNLFFAHSYNVIDVLQPMLKRNDMAFSSTMVQVPDEPAPVLKIQVSVCTYSDGVGDKLYELITDAINRGLFESGEQTIMDAELQAIFNTLGNHYTEGGKEQAIAVRQKILDDIKEAGYIGNTAQTFLNTLDDIINEVK